jgi:hypothetical protein
MNTSNQYPRTTGAQGGLEQKGPKALAKDLIEAGIHLPASLWEREQNGALTGVDGCRVILNRKGYLEAK